MKLLMKLLLCVAGILSFVICFSQSECGKRLEKGTVMCILISKGATIQPFEFNLCTHAVIYGFVECKNESCDIGTNPEYETSLNWTRPNLPHKVGLLIGVNRQILHHLNTTTRRTNAVNDIVNTMHTKGLTFLSPRWQGHLVNQNEIDVISAFHLFIEELAGKLHERDFHIGLDFGVGGLPFYDLERMAKVVDWIGFSSTKSSFSGYMESLTPLRSSYRKEFGSLKFLIEKVLQLLKPDCLVFDVGPRIIKQFAIHTAVEPGPGSLGITANATSHDISNVCYQLLINSTCHEYWDDESKTPWTACGDVFYSYENDRSLRLKIDLAKEYNISKVMFWGLDISPENICGDGDPLVLLRAVQGIRQSN